MGEDLPDRSKAQDLPVCPWDCGQRPQEGDRNRGQRKDCHLIWSSLIGRGNFEKSGEGGLEETVSKLF